MWEAPPPDSARDVAGNGQETLTPAVVEGVLADFRSWLQHVSATALAAQPADHETQAIDLHTLLGQSVALRHDVNLQTKAARSQQELTAEALQQLSQSLEALRQAQSTAEQANQQTQDEALRPLLKILLDAHDALSVAEREIRRTPDAIRSLLEELTVESLPRENAAADGDVEPIRESTLVSRLKPSLWQRLFGRDLNESDSRARLQAHQQRQEHLAYRERYQALLSSQQEKIERASKRLDQLIDSMVIGYRMSLQRLERAIERSGLEPIPCVGQTFDPEQMEVVAVDTDSGRPSGEVIEEVRRGYWWHGRVFRYAQVSVAKS